MINDLGPYKTWFSSKQFSKLKIHFWSPNFLHHYNNYNNIEHRVKVWGIKTSEKQNESRWNEERTLKKGWDLISSAPLGPEPSLLWGSFTSNFRSRSCAKEPMIEGNGGSQRRMRLSETKSSFNSGKYLIWCMRKKSYHWEFKHCGSSLCIWTCGENH